MIIVAIIVTYGDRYHLCKQVVQSCLSQRIAEIVIVDNASNELNAAKIGSLRALDSRVKIIRMSRNTGSSGGFKVGLETAMEMPGLDRLWLLDDDNVPDENALEALVKTQELMELQGEAEAVLYSYRGDSRPEDRKAILGGKIKEYLPNNFNGFNFSHTMRSKFQTRSVESKVNYPIVRVGFGPYGGLFLTPSAIGRVGFPDDRYFLYADDHDLTLRLSAAGYTQYLVYASRLTDIDVSLPEVDPLFSSDVSEVKIYYGIRNHTHLCQKFRGKGMVYSLNKSIFLANLGVRALKYVLSSPGLVFRRLRLVCRAVRDGEAGRLGATF